MGQTLDFFYWNFPYFIAHISKCGIFNKIIEKCMWIRRENNDLKMESARFLVLTNSMIFIFNQIGVLMYFIHGQILYLKEKSKAS